MTPINKIQKIKSTENDSHIKTSLSILSNNTKSEFSKELSNIQNFKYKKFEQNNNNLYSDKEETTISFKHECSSNNLNSQTINGSSMNLDLTSKSNVKLKNYLKKEVTDPIKKSAYDINSNNNSSNNSSNLNNLISNNLVGACNNNNYMLSLPNNIGNNVYKSNINIMNQDVCMAGNNKMIKTNLSKFKSSAISIKPMTGKSKTNKNNSCNYVNAKSQIIKEKKNISNKNLNFSNNSINNINNISCNNNFTNSRKTLITQPLLLKNETNGIPNYTNNNGKNNNPLIKEKIGESNGHIINNIIKNKYDYNYSNETEINLQTNVSYSINSEIIKAKPIKFNKHESSEKTIENKIDNIINKNIGKIKFQLDSLDKFLKVFEKETELIKKNI